MRRAVAIVALSLAGCATAPAAPVVAQCDAAPVQALVGRPAAAIADEARRRSGAGIVRRYTTGDALTRDYRIDRLNIESDTAGTVVALTCG